MTRTFTFVALFCALLHNSCNKNSSQEFSSDDFPNAEGDQWSYSRYDSINSTYDTVHVIISDTIASGTTVQGIWDFTFTNSKNPYVSDYYYRVSILSGTVIFENSLYGLAEHRFLFPIQISDEWTLEREFYHDTTRVVSSEDFILPDNSIRTAYRIIQHVGRPDGNSCSEAYYSFWIIPDIGIVRYRENVFIGTKCPATMVTNEEWNLLNYQLAQ